MMKLANHGVFGSSIGGNALSPPGFGPSFALRGRWFSLVLLVMMRFWRVRTVA